MGRESTGRREMTIQTPAAPAAPHFVSPKLLAAAALPAALRRVVARPSAGAHSVVAGFASELILGPAEDGLAGRRGPSARYLVVIDVPDAALMRLPALLDLRRPD